MLIPLLLAYAAILLAYAGQIAITRPLPEGMIGWMVLGFVMAGAATWLVLYPPFLRGRVIVRAFRRSWFWATLIPLDALRRSRSGSEWTPTALPPSA